VQKPHNSEFSLSFVVFEASGFLALIEFKIVNESSPSRHGDTFSNYKKKEKSHT
jgi:hypothetical protein